MNPHDLTTEELTAELEAMRETPSQDFAARLDARATAGFPRRGTELFTRFAEADSIQRISESVRSASPRRKMLPALAGVATVVVVATAVVVSTDGGGSSNDRLQTGVTSSSGAEAGGGSAKAAPRSATKTAPSALAAPQQVDQGPVASPLDDFDTDSRVISPTPPLTGGGGVPGVRDRQVERSAELTLGTEPEQVQDVSGKAIDVVGRYRGFVLSSQVRDGSEGDAGARFELLIPSSQLSAALADLSGIAEVRSRSENTLDITAPYVSAREHLRDARADAEGLLRQLAAADTETERGVVKARLEVVRGQIAAFRSQVDRLQRRSNFSKVSLDVVTGKGETFGATGGGDWTVGDALSDAGRVLAVAAGVTLLGAALILPFVLLGGLLWGARRIYLRRARAATLSPQP